MRRGLGLSTVAIAVLMTAGLLRAQAQDIEPRYWPLREINFPVPIEKIQAMSPRPAKLRFYVSRDRGPFERIVERTLNDLEVIDLDRNRKGFRYTSPADGEYSFALQFVYTDGDVNPRESDLAAQYRVVFDTRPPVVRAAVAGTSGIEWEVQDDNPKADSVELQVRWVGQQNFTTVSPRALGLRDKYTWNGLTAAQPLEVRIVAKDKAGHEAISRPLTLPAAGIGTGLERDPNTRPGTGRPGTSPGGLNEIESPNRPAIDYVNSRTLTIESKLTRVTRSGVKAAHLWVNDGKGNWIPAKTHPVNILPTTPDPTLRIPFSAEKDGLYGFIVIPENGAGGRQEDPRAGDPAQFLIEVDTEKPHIKVKGTKVSPGGAIGPRVEIEWDAVDKNLMPEPIVLEYSEDKTAAEWKPITPGKVSNSGRYVWEVEDKNIWRFYVRASAVDKASNRSEHVYEKEIVIDLEKPAAVIQRVQGSGGAPVPHQSERPSDPPVPTPTPSTPAPAPAPKPGSSNPGTPAPEPPPAIPTLPTSTPSTTPVPAIPASSPKSPVSEPPAIPSLPDVTPKDPKKK